jgi:DNA-directed RNA polymerase specialized sigma24 family protein
MKIKRAAVRAKSSNITPKAAGPVTGRTHPTKKPSWLVGFDPGGVTWGDLITLESGQLQRPEKRSPDSDRMEAAKWIADNWRLNRPIAPQRWQAIGPAVMQELVARACVHNSSPEAELANSVAGALLQSIDELGGILTACQSRSGQPVPFRVAVRSRVNDLVTEDLLGSNWRKYPGEEKLALEEALNRAFGESPLEGKIVAQLEDPAAAEAFRQIEDCLELEAIVNQTNLGEREAEIIAGLRNGEQLTDIAERLGIKPGTANVASSRALKKLQSAAQSKPRR